MMPESTGARSLPFSLRSLRVQLLLWIVVPLALVLVFLSLTGVSRHRQMMDRLVEDRDRSMVLAEANRLGREIAAHASLVGRLAATPGLADDPGIAGDAVLQLDSPLDLAVFDQTGRVQALSGQGRDWSEGDSGQLLGDGSRQANEPQVRATVKIYNGRLLVAAPTGSGRMLLGSVPVSSLDMFGGGLLPGSRADNAFYLLSDEGEVLHSSNPSSLPVDTLALRSLPIEAGLPGTSQVDIGRETFVASYAPVDPLGWLLVTVARSDASTFNDIGVVEALPITLLLIVLLALLALSFAAAYVIRPLQVLAERATQVAWGDFDAVYQPVGGVQEVDDLREALAQMAHRVRTYQSGMRDYLSAVTLAQEEERSRLAHELHDETVQGLVALKQRAQMAKKAIHRDTDRAAGRLEELGDLIDQQLLSLRRLIGDLRPVCLDDLGFLPALQTLAASIEREHGLAVRVEVTGDVVRVASDLELAAFRIVQQALANSVAHAHARNIFVRVDFSTTQLSVQVRDDGCGFVPPDQPADLARHGHFGLMGMHERALLYGGQMNVVSGPGQGTIIAAWLPIC